MYDMRKPVVLDGIGNKNNAIIVHDKKKSK